MLKLLGNIKKIFYLSSIYSLGSIAQNVVLFIFIPIYTSYLSVEDFGILALMNLIVNLCTKFVMSPVAASLNRYYYKPDYIKKNGVLLFNLFVFLVAITGGIIVLYYYSTGIIHSFVFDSKYDKKIILLYIPLIVLQPISAFFLQLIRLRKKARYYIIVSFSSLIISSITTLLLLVKFHYGIYAVIGGLIINHFVLAILSSPIFFTYAKFVLNGAILKEPLKYGYPIILSGYSNLLINSGDRYVLRVYRSVADIGLYDFGYRIASILKIVLVDPVNQGLQPIIFQKEAEPDEQRELLRYGATYYYMIAMFITVALALFSKDLIMGVIKNEEFWASWKLVPFIAFAYAQHGLGQFLGWGMVMKKKSYLVSMTILVSAVVNIGLNIILIPQWGLIGAAIATIASYFVWNALKMYYSATLYDLFFEKRKLFLITMVGILCMAFGIGLTLEIGLLASLGVKIFILVIYIPLFLFMGFWNKRELLFIGDIFRSVKNIGIQKTFIKIHTLTK